MIQKYLSNENLIEKVLSVDEILSMAKEGNKINIMMGQTFDEGQPLEMIKYGLFIMGLSDLLEEKGVEVTSNWLIADHFMTDINEDKLMEEAKKQAEERINYLNSLNDLYGGKIGIILSSELSKRENYKKNLELLSKRAEDNPVFRNAVLEAIPKDRRNNPKAIGYPLEELATIESLNTDIKVGPKYEIKYDEPARTFAPMIGFRKFSAIHLRNSYPFGNPEMPDDIKEEIESYGILPYKINSKGLKDFRIDPTKNTPEEIRNIIELTKNEKTLLDLSIINNLAKRRILKKDLPINGLSEDLVGDYEKYIGSHLRN